MPAIIQDARTASARQAPIGDRRIENRSQPGKPTAEEALDARPEASGNALATARFDMREEAESNKIDLGVRSLIGRDWS
ncbi:MAG: hypothetical protein ACLQIB_32740 [Isosphaeraceae bacterium]